MILIVSHPEDDHANGVLSELFSQGHPVTLLDTAQFPVRASLSQTFADDEVCVEYVTDGKRVNLTACHTAWWRRPLPYTLHNGLDPDVVSFTYGECHEALAGALALLDATWVNEPKIDERAHHKPLQLATAARVGLAVPRTLISNDPDEARRFLSDLGPGNAIYKTFIATEEHWRETRVLRDEELAMLDSVAFAPVIFQEYIGGGTDIRVTVIGDEMFATAIRPDPHAYVVDYRMDISAASFTPTELPDEVKNRLLALTRALGIIYGAVDLMHTADGQYIFLEVNPAGEWRFVEERTAQPMTRAMADLLIRLDVPPED